MMNIFTIISISYPRENNDIGDIHVEHDTMWYLVGSDILGMYQLIHDGSKANAKLYAKLKYWKKDKRNRSWKYVYGKISSLELNDL